MISIGNTFGGVILTVIMAIFLFAGILVGLFLITRNAGTPKDKVYKSSIIPVSLLIIGAIGLIIRLVFALLIRGYRDDIGLMTLIIQATGLSSIYGGITTPNTLSPIMVYLMSIMGGFGSLFGVEADTVGMQMLIKIPFILADIGVFVLIYFIASRYLNKAISVVLASLVYLSPAVLWNSAISGQFNSITALILLGVLYLMLKRKFLFMIILYGVAVLTDSFALWFFPPLAILLGYYFVRAIQYIRGEQIGFRDKRLVTDANARPIVSVPFYLIATLIGMYLVTLPLMAGQMFESRNFFTVFFNDFLIQPFGSNVLFGNNALSVYNIFLRNWLPLGDGFPHTIFAWAFVALVFGIVAFVYYSKKNRANLALATIYAVFTVAFYFVGFRESTLIVLLPLLILAYVIIQDKRIMHIFAVLSLIIFINSATVMLSAYWLNNESISAFAGTNTHHLISGFGRVVNIICSGIAFMLHIYFTYILLDIAMSNSRRQIRTFDTKPNFADAIVDWISIKKRKGE